MTDIERALIAGCLMIIKNCGGDNRHRKIAMNKPITIKPHHFLDIIKLYGNGLEKFVPDKNYGHDFYKVGNIILAKYNIIILPEKYIYLCK